MYSAEDSSDIGEQFLVHLSENIEGESSTSDVRQLECFDTIIDKRRRIRFRADFSWRISGLL